MRSVFIMWLAPLFALLIALLALSACQSKVTTSNAGRKQPFQIENFKFEKTFLKDRNDSDWNVIEFRPSHLPYTGVVAEMTAQERWIKLFEKSLEAVSEECRKPISHLPEIKGDEADYSKFGKSAQYPKFLRVRFSCK